MKHHLSRGKRIRAADKELVFRFATAALLPLFLLVVLLFHSKAIMQTDWQNLPILQEDFSIDIPYLLISKGH